MRAMPTRLQTAGIAATATGATHGFAAMGCSYETFIP